MRSMLLSLLFLSFPCIVYGEGFLGPDERLYGEEYHRSYDRADPVVYSLYVRRDYRGCIESILSRDMTFSHIYFLAQSYQNLKKFNFATPLWRSVMIYIPEIKGLASFYLAKNAYERKNYKEALKWLSVTSSVKYSLFHCKAIEIEYKIAKKTGDYNKFYIRLNQYASFASPRSQECVYLMRARAHAKLGNFNEAWFHLTLRIGAGNWLKDAHDMEEVFDNLLARGYMPASVELISYAHVLFFRKKYKKVIKVLRGHPLPSFISSENRAQRLLFLLKATNFLKDRNNASSYEKKLQHLCKEVTDSRVCEEFEYVRLLVRPKKKAKDFYRAHVTNLLKRDGYRFRKSVLNLIFHKQPKLLQQKAKFKIIKTLLKKGEATPIIAEILSFIKKGKLKNLHTHYQPLCKTGSDRKTRSEICFWLAQVADFQKKPQHAAMYLKEAFQAYENAYAPFMAFEILSKNSRKYGVSTKALRRDYEERAAAYWSQPAMLSVLRSAVSPDIWQDHIHDPRFWSASVLFHLGDFKQGRAYLRAWRKRHLPSIGPLFLALSQHFSEKGWTNLSAFYASRWAAYVNRTGSLGGNFIPKDVSELYYPRTYGKIIKKYAKKYGVNQWLIQAVIRQESYYFPYAVSSARAEGLMQLMPATSKSLASQVGLKNYETFRPDHNIQMGSFYLSRLLYRFTHSSHALAAYNGGPGRMRSRLRLYRRKYAIMNDPYHLPKLIGTRETRDYVQSVLSMAMGYRFVYAKK